MFKFPFRRSSLEELDKKLVFSLRKARIPGLRQLKLLPELLNPTERWVLRGASALLIVGLTLLVTPGVVRHTVAVPKAGGVYTEALVGTPRLINPILATSDVDRDLARLIYSGLLRYNGKGELEGDLAERFEIGAAGLEITFTLRENLRFHDGQPLTAQDVLFTLETIKNPAWRSPLWRSFQDVTVETPDARTVKVRFGALSASSAHLFTVGILPKRLWEGVEAASADRAIWNVKPVGAGPFRFKNLAKSEHGGLSAYTFVRSESYHHGAPYLARISVRFFPDFESAVEALREHRVDGISFVPARLSERIPTKGFTTHSLNLPSFTSIFFQDRKNEFLKERAVRAALARAINREEIAALVKYARATDTPFLETEIGFAKTLRRAPFDREKAALLLESGGWTRKEIDGNNRWVKNKKTLKVTLTTLDEPTFVQVSDRIKHAWEALGVEVALEVVPRASFEREVLRGRAFEALLYSQVGGADPDPYAFWHSSQIDDPGVNLSSIKSRAVDLALEQGRSTLDTNKRLLRYIDFQNAFLEEVPGIILYASPYLYVTSQRIRGIATERIASPADRWYGIEKWYRRWRPGWQ